MSAHTIYKGCKFKSELAARWAVFFDSLGVKWEYQPEEIAVGAGVTYTPDFIIYDVVPRYAQGDTKENLYVAVVENPNAVDALKIKLFSERHHIWVVGELPDPDNYVDSCEKQREKFCEIVRTYRYDPAYTDFCVLCPYDHGTIDGDTCFEFSLGFDYNTLSFHGADSSYDYGHHYVEIEQALRNAISAEFDDKPDVDLDDKYVKKLVTMVVEVDVPDYVSDDFIRHEVEQEIHCASVFSDVKSFYISEPLKSVDEEE